MITSLAPYQHRPLKKPLRSTARYQKAVAYFETPCNEEIILMKKKQHRILYFSPNQGIKRSIHASPQSIMNALESGCCNTARCSENKSY